MESLTAKMGLDTNGYARDMKKAEGITGRAAKKMAGMFASFLTVGALVSLGKQAMDTADRIGNLADRLGITTDEVQDFINAAQAAGISLNSAEMALQRWTRRLAEAQQGKGELIGIFEKYNIQVRDTNGRVRTAADVLADYADAIKGAESSQERLRMAFKAFDSEGADLVRILSEGREGLKAFTEEGNKMFGKFSEEATRELQAAKLEIEAFQNRLTVGFGNILIDFKSEAGLKKLGYGLMEQAASFGGFLVGGIINAARVMGIVFSKGFKHSLGIVTGGFTTFISLMREGLDYFRSLGQAAFEHLFDTLSNKWDAIASGIKKSLLTLASDVLAKFENIPLYGKDIKNAREKIQGELSNLKAPSSAPVTPFSERIKNIESIPSRISKALGGHLDNVVVEFSDYIDEVGESIGNLQGVKFEWADKAAAYWRERKDAAAAAQQEIIDANKKANEKQRREATITANHEIDEMDRVESARSSTAKAEPSGLKPVTVHRGISGEILNWDALTPEQRAALASTRYATDPRRSARVASLKTAPAGAPLASPPAGKQPETVQMAKDIAELKKATQSIDIQIQKIMGQ